MNENVASIIETLKQKDGWKTSEFWSKIGLQALLVLPIVLAVVPATSPVGIGLGVAVTVLEVLYGRQRATVKRDTASKIAATVQALAAVTLEPAPGAAPQDARKGVVSGVPSPVSTPGDTQVAPQGGAGAPETYQCATCGAKVEA